MKMSVILGIAMMLRAEDWLPQPPVTVELFSCAFMKRPVDSRPTNKNPSRTIQIEQEERHAADCRPRGDFVAVPLEMIPPVVQPWIEKRDGHAN